MIYKVNGVKASLVGIIFIVVLIVILIVAFNLLIFLIPLILILLLASYFFKILNKLKKEPTKDYIDIKHKVKKK